MRSYFIKTPSIVMQIFSNYTWRFLSDKKEIFLTFDDGPIPVVTEFILDILQKHQVKATFFCVGENIKKYPTIYNRIVNEGHQTGNHTYNHLNGWKTKTDKYIANVEKCRSVQESLLFRPPYGKITKKQATILIEKGYKIIMWRLLSGDFDINNDPKKCYQNITNNIKSGDIIVFHDNIKSQEKILQILEKTITTLKNKGYNFKAIR
ncbi:MAG TPA: polysaccharide deacetylase family protein [Flavobacteriia bacterium]|nr:polysaccharide deacetylase family protein [Flavobacteriia bacterium]